MNQISLCAVLSLLAWFALTTAAQAQTGFICPYDPIANPARCEKLERRYEKEQVKKAQIAEIEAHRIVHPLRVSLVVEGQLLAHGLGHSYVAAFWGISLGASLSYEVMPNWALRSDLLGRFGRGKINNWNIDYPGPIDAPAGLLGGIEAQAAFVRRMRSAYFGPAVSLGFMHLDGKTLNESDYGYDGADFDPSHPVILHVPNNAAFMAGGIMLGWELAPEGVVGLSVHFLPGIWNDLRHFYLDVACVMTVKVWD